MQNGVEYNFEKIFFNIKRHLTQKSKEKMRLQLCAVCGVL